mmetsp:Transcript_102409/g.256607  ORF Transcript_102409/g.256607 Transcript_102409/m.256607 type:complete len:287 (-) Transcript_102409:750-1610(-)
MSWTLWNKGHGAPRAKALGPAPERSPPPSNCNGLPVAAAVWPMIGRAFSFLCKAIHFFSSTAMCPCKVAISCPMGSRGPSWRSTAGTCAGMMVDTDVVVATSSTSPVPPLPPPLPVSLQATELPSALFDILPGKIAGSETQVASEAEEPTLLRDDASRRKTSLNSKRPSRHSRLKCSHSMLALLSFSDNCSCKTRINFKWLLASDFALSASFCNFRISTSLSCASSTSRATIRCAQLSSRSAACASSEAEACASSSCLSYALLSAEASVVATRIRSSAYFTVSCKR